MTITQQQAQLIAKLRYQGKQYAAGQVARGGAGQKHYLEEAADELEMMALALSMEKVTPQSARENADLRNVIQAACIDGLPGLARAWEKYFPDHPISIKGIEQGAGADVQIVPAGTLVHMQGLPFNLKSDALMEGANFHLLEKQTPSVEGAATVQSTYEAVERQSGETGELYQTATSDDALQALIYASKVYRAHGIPTDGLAGKAAEVRAAIIADLCGDVEPVAFMFQHDESGRIIFVDAWQKENGWSVGNPRFFEVGALVPASTLAAAQALNAELVARVAELGAALRTADRTFAENGILASHAARQEIQSALTKGQQ